MPDNRVNMFLDKFQALTMPEMRAVLDAAEGIYEDRQRLAESLMSQLGALGVHVPDPTADAVGSAAGQKLHAKYRSIKNPALTWAGRGKIAAWLEEEMRESGLPKEAFLIVNQVQSARLAKKR